MKNARTSAKSTGRWVKQLIEQAKRFYRLAIRSATHSRDKFRPRLKAAIVQLAVWGVLPVTLAEWLIQRGGLRHV